MIHQMKLVTGHFRKIINGNKIIESRLYDKKRHQIDIGDQIEFTCVDSPARKVLTKVVALYRYQTFDELFSDFPPEYFGGTSKGGLIKEIKNFYSKEEQNKYGVIGIKIQLIQ